MDRPLTIEFDGKTYRLNGNYYRSGKSRLHVAIYEKENGPVPPGLHIHHIDFDPFNNDPSNLIALTPLDHKKIHDSVKRIPFVCETCAKDFLSVRKNKRFCSKKCQQNARWHSGVDVDFFPCLICDTKFMKNRYSKTSTCSPACAKIRWRFVRRKNKEVPNSELRLLMQ